MFLFTHSPRFLCSCHQSGISSPSVHYSLAKIQLQLCFQGRTFIFCHVQTPEKQVSEISYIRKRKLEFYVQVQT